MIRFLFRSRRDDISLRDDILLHLMIWSGTRLFGFVSVYPAEVGDSERVLAVHFARDEKVMNRSCEDFLNE